jgi:sugar phosphate isomerase/epimerase
VAIELGVDTLCYRARLIEGDITHEEVATEVAALGFRWLQLNARIGGLAEWSLDRMRALGQHIGAAGLGVIYSGIDIGGHGSDPERVRRAARCWMEQAKVLEAPILRVHSKRFRNELEPPHGDLLAELAFLEQLLPLLSKDADAAGITVAVENHSNLKAEELAAIVEGVGEPSLRIHLDVANAVSVFEDPAATAQRLFPLSVSGHVKAFRVESIYAPEGRYRLGFQLLWTYPGEGGAEIEPALELLRRQQRAAPFPLTIEGLNHARGDRTQSERLLRSQAYLAHLGID